MHGFDYRSPAYRVVFGHGVRARLPELMEEVGIERALVLSTPEQADTAAEISEALGAASAGMFAEAAMHTPLAVTERALAVMDASNAAATVAVGGGSTIGLGKAVARRRGTPQVVVPTTYAGSEMTPIVGETEGDEKRTHRDPAIQPGLVIYDVDLTLGLPPAMTITSGVNAIAHAVEALYARDRNPVTSLMAVDAVRALAGALPVLAERPRDPDARARALYGAWLCGAALGQTDTAFHHKLCHALGGTLGLLHAPTHTVVLPYATAFNEAHPAVAPLLRPLAEALGAPGAAQGLMALNRAAGAPTDLAALGMTAADSERVAEVVMRRPYWNPRPYDREDVVRVLEAARTAAPVSEAA